MGAGAERVAALYAREKPQVALHFGVSERAQGLVVETLGAEREKPALRRCRTAAVRRRKSARTARRR